jgi:hypothetical protein
MAKKRFTDIEIWDKEWFMDLSPKLKCLVRYLFDKCDPSGVWNPNWKLASMHIKDQVTEADLKGLPKDQYEMLPGGKIFLPDFISFQYGFLSEKSPAHKPIFKAIEKNRLADRVFGRLSNNLQEKDKEMEEDKEMDKKDDGLEETNTNPDSLLEQMATVFVEHNPGYPLDRLTDLPMVRSIAEKIAKWQKLEGQIVLDKNRKIIKHRWGELVPKIRADSHLSKYSLTQINKHFQSVVQTFNNVGTPTTKQSNSAGSGKPSGKSAGANILLNTLREEIGGAGPG